MDAECEHKQRGPRNETEWAGEVKDVRKGKGGMTRRRLRPCGRS